MTPNVGDRHRSLCCSAVLDLLRGCRHSVYGARTTNTVVRLFAPFELPASACCVRGLIFYLHTLKTDAAEGRVSRALRSSLWLYWPQVAPRGSLPEYLVIALVEMTKVQSD
jgi:hypothetical protein